MTAKILSHGGIKISRSPLHNTKVPVSTFPKSWHIPHPIFKGTLEKWFMNKGHKLLPVQTWSSAASCQRTAHVSFSTGQPCNAWCNSLHQDLSFPPTRRWGQNPWLFLPHLWAHLFLKPCSGTSVASPLQSLHVRHHMFLKSCIYYLHFLQCPHWWFYKHNQKTATESCDKA